MEDGGEDREFFRAEIERLMDRLYGTALRLTRNRADAEDLVAEAVTKAWAHLSELADRRCFQKWLLRILANTFVSDRRRARPEVHIELDDCPFSLFEKMHQPFLLWWSNPELELLNKLLRQDIEAAIDAIPAEFRAVLVLVELNGQPVVIGRSHSCTLALNDGQASKEHLRIEWTPEGYRLTDLASTMGTRVNDKPAQQQILKDLDRIAIGSSIIVFESDAV